ncbi:hypothetical protein ANO11243_011590 [Dothideomycetidae sp. 11243]|nr:hypothetical protein ANO11243_011590 [fungal sp. No.11243]
MHIRSQILPRLARHKSLPQCQRRHLVIKLDDGQVLQIQHLVRGAAEARNEKKEFQVNGFVQSIRKQKRVVFVAVKDGSSFETLQAVLRPEDGKDLSVGQAVSMKGTLERCREGAQQTHELHVTEAFPVGDNEAESNPLQNKYQSPQFLRTIPHLRPRLPSQTVLLNLRSKVIKHVTNYFSQHDWTQTHPPLITSSDCEGAGEVFTVASNAPSDSKAANRVEHHFRTPKYLTVSAQLHLEALAQAVDRVWCLSPTFRAEKSDTARHLSEFYMLEAEMSFVQNINQLMIVLEQMIKYITQNITTDPKLRLDLLARLGSSQPPEGDKTEGPSMDEAALKERWSKMNARKPWTRVTYDSAFETLVAAAESGEQRFATNPNYRAGFQAEHERFLAEKLGNGAPIFIYNYPREQKPFYMLPDPASDGKYAACFDLIAPDVCELAGGSLREHKLGPLTQAMRDKGVLSKEEGLSTDAAKAGQEVDTMDWYLDLRRYGSVPHGGFGLGFDRLLCYLAGVSNVRDVVTFPRYHGRCDA